MKRSLILSNRRRCSVRADKLTAPRWGVPLYPLLVVFLGGAMMFGQDLPFDSGSTGADGAGPFSHINQAFTPGRAGAAMAFDTARGELVMFGGNGALDETWAWSGTDWVKKIPANKPAGRSDTMMAYDATREQVVLFGGYLNATRSTNDTWIWNGTNWSVRTTSTSPPPRFLHALSYDAARQEVILFGGRMLPPSIELNDTWAWNGTNWTLKTSRTIPPEPLEGCGLCYDEVRRELVLFGGWRAGNFLSETWTWDGTNWVRKNTVLSPQGRLYPGLAFDAARQRVVLFGGYSATGVSLDDTWTWDGETWTQLFPESRPPGRS